ncbi:unnamed protein product [Moneuplotes crassus]|uniref:Carbohydrate kinase PfkB domain-containing protein n=1 Tax=Euplotes crassus TaxID=5936 RepID=A0AAD2CZ09_EUPCR|nr:unnamed protein product [Moneuplotes crassus]
MESKALKRISILKNHVSATQPTEVTIVGGAAVDVIARTKDIAKINNSNIGFVDIKYGGTSRNVSECITRLGFGSKLKFITSIGKNDSFGHLLNKSFDDLKMRKDGIHYSSDFPTAVFCAVINPSGGMEIGVNDMDCHPNLPISHIKLQEKDISSSKVVLVDTNVSENAILETLSLAKEVKWTIVEPISLEKSSKVAFKNILPLISILKPNDDQFEDVYNLFKSYVSTKVSRFTTKEEELLAKSEIIFEASKVLSEKYNCADKLKYIVITCGKDGVRLVSRSPLKHDHFEAVDVKVINAVGAGDTFCGGLISGLLHYKQEGIEMLSSAIKLGMRCSTLTIQSTENIAHEISKDLL